MNDAQEQRAWEQQYRDGAAAALHVVCPLCGATAGEACTYPLAIRSDDDAQRFLRWELVERTPHRPRVAVATDGELYGYALRQLLRDCVCGTENAMAGQHPRPSCGYHWRQA